LPIHLPISLRELQCSHNKITELPLKLPVSLQNLFCNHNQIIEFPSSLPYYIREIQWHNNKYMYIPHAYPIYHISETPNYNKKALKIQKIWKPRKIRQLIHKIINDINDDNVLSKSFKHYGDLNIIDLIIKYIY